MNKYASEGPKIVKMFHSTSTSSTAVEEAISGRSDPGAYRNA
ncbi:MAG: hypothetical protein QXF92_03735 [Thermosphaera sp.]